MKSQRAVIRASAADALGEMRDPRAVAALTPLLRDKSDEVVLWATLAMSKLGDASVQALGSTLEEEAGTLPRAGYLADALSKTGTPDARKRLRRALSLLGVDARTRLLAFIDVQDL